MAKRSSIYLAGNKYKLWDSLKDNLQDGSRSTLVDVFGGSGTITLNACKEEMFENYVYNEKASHLFQLQEWVKDFNVNDVKVVKAINEHYTSTKEGFLSMKSDYNESIDKPVEMLYNLMCRSNSNMMRFNGSGDYNMTFGERNRCDVNRIMEHRNLIQDVILTNLGFEDLLNNYLFIGNLENYTFYLDPPYLGTKATYNENGGWGEEQNALLLNMVLQLQEKGAKVVLSNIFYNRGFEHKQLIDFCEENNEKLVVKHLNISYNNSSFRKSTQVTDEVLVITK